MHIKPGQLPILIVNIAAIVFFLLKFASQKNYEFLIYIGVIVFFISLILSTNTRVAYPNLVLWGLTLWGIMHMAGGGIRVGDGVLYSVMLVPLSSTYPVLRYDQLVHIIGFGVATLVMYVLLKPHLKKKPQWATGIVLVMAGLGVGALNEIIEFVAVLLLPQTGVGGYVNTSLDLVSDLIGAILAIVFLKIKKWEI